MDLRKNAEHLMCNLTTEWILENAQSFSVCTYIYILVMFYGSGEWPQNERELRCPEGSGMLIGDPLW